MKPPLHPAAPEQPPRANPNRRQMLRGALASVGALGSLALSGCAEPPAETVALGYGGGVLSMRLSPNGEQALVGSVQQGAGLWNWRTQQRLANLSHAEQERAQVFASAFAPDGTRGVTAERNNLVHWDLATGRVLGHWSAQASVRSVALSNQGRRILAGLNSREAWLFDGLNVRLPVIIPHAEAVRAVDISADAALGATGADDGMLRAWDLERGAAFITWKFEAPVTTAVFSPDRRQLFAGPAHGQGRIWDLAQGTVLHPSLGGVRGGFSQARFSADGALLLTAAANGQITLWTVASGQARQSWQLPRSLTDRTERLGVLDIGFDAQTRLALVAVTSGQVLVWRLG